MIQTGSKPKVIIILFIIVLPLLAACTSGPQVSSDWPMWRYDANRSASSPEELPPELHLEWVHRYSPRTLTWDNPLNRDIMHYDKVFEPIVVGKSLIIGFNDSDKVVALHTGSGKEQWVFHTDGPVRFPPVGFAGRIYFTCDDGYLYCVKASNGSLVWKFRGGPNDRKILGNRRLISSWPARGAPVIVDGTVYFGASIWPLMGTFIYALDAETGKVIWKNDSTGAQYIIQPHNAPSFAGVAPQGVFVAVGDRLLIPGGRSVPACFDRHTGEYLYYQLGSSGKTGGAFVCSTEDVFFNHLREQDTTMYDLETGVKISPHLGRYPVLDGGMFYFSGKEVSAYNSKWIRKSIREWKEAEIKTRDIQRRASEQWKENHLWNLNVDASGDLIKAGNRLYAAGGNTITAVELSDGPETPSVAWTKTVDGTVERLIAANGRLFAVTLDGRIMAFGRKKAKPRTLSDHPVAAGSSGGMTERAIEILGTTGVKEGYALFYGIGDGHLLEALVHNSELNIIAVDPDAEKVKKMHRRFDEAGLYGKRLAVLQGDPFTVMMPQYMASLTIVYDLDSNRYPRDEKMLGRIYYSMRPYGGKAWFNDTGSDPGAFSTMITEANLPGIEIIANSSPAIISRVGQLEGSAYWTHNYGDIANTAKSDDKLVKLPMGILWFGGNSNFDVLPRHGHGPTEQVIGGRLFVEGIDSMNARDVYTGRLLWKVPIYDLGTFGVYYDETYKDTPTSTRYNQVHIPGANIRGTNYVATLDRVYIIQGGSCLVLNAETGETDKVISLPPEDPEARRPVTPPWGYIGVYDDLLIAGSDFVAFSDLLLKKKKEYSRWEDFDKSASKKLVVMDRYTGDVIWQIESRYGFLHNGVAAGSDRIYCLDKLPPHIEKQIKRRGRPAPGDYRLLALDIRTGAVLWEAQENIFGSFLSYSKENDILLQSTRPSSDTVRDETGERMIAYRGDSGDCIWDKALEYPTFPILHGEKIITEGNMFSLLTGEQVYRVNPFTHENVDWAWRRMYGCNYPIASEHLVTFRSGAAGFYDLTGSSGTGNFGGFKSGCTAELVAADGVLNAPDYNRTCNCAYQNQTSLALVHMPENELWTFNTYSIKDVTVKNIGLNLGAPGDRLADNGTLWLDYPNVGGPSPEITVSTSPENPKWFLHHSSFYKGSELPWIASSGSEGLRRITISLPGKSSEPRLYTVRLYFAEPENVKVGERVFDVLIQGNRMIDRLDIAAEAGASKKALIKEFTGIGLSDSLVIAFVPAGRSGNREPVINGIEVVAEGW